MFFILGITACKMLSTTDGYEGELFCQGNANWFNDKRNMYYKAGVKSKDLSEEERKIKRNAVLGRIIPALVGSAMAVVVEILLNACGVLTWEKSWWQASMPIILYIIGYCPFFFAAVAYTTCLAMAISDGGIIGRSRSCIACCGSSLDMLGANRRRRQLG